MGKKVAAFVKDHAPQGGQGVLAFGGEQRYAYLIFQLLERHGDGGRSAGKTLCRTPDTTRLGHGDEDPQILNVEHVMESPGGWGRLPS